MKYLFIGDSVTVGAFTRGGYKPAFRALMIGSGKIDTELVGPFDDMYVGQDSAGKTIVEHDPMIRHAGIGGTKALGLKDSTVKSWISIYKPDLVIMSFGLNDFASDKASPQAVLAKLDSIVKANPGPIWKVSSLNLADYGASAFNNSVRTFNTLLSAKPYFLDTAGNWNKLIEVEKITGVFHPNQRGYDEMAKSVYHGLIQVAGAPAGTSPSNVCDTSLCRSALVGPLVWRNDAKNLTVITDTKQGSAAPSTGNEIILAMGPSDRDVFIKNVVKPWRSSAEKYCAQYNVPLPWVLGTMWQESRGNPRAKSSAGAIGLMQLVYGKEGHSDQELMDNPDLNIQLGVKAISSIMKSLGASTANPKPSVSLPNVASCYNAGAQVTSGFQPHPSTADKLWLIRNENQGYITPVVMAANTFILFGGGAGGATPSGTSTKTGSSVLVPIALGLGAVALLVPWGKI